MFTELESVNCPSFTVPLIALGTPPIEFVNDTSKLTQCDALECKRC